MVTSGLQPQGSSEASPPTPAVAQSLQAPTIVGAPSASCENFIDAWPHFFGLVSCCCDIWLSEAPSLPTYIRVGDEGEGDLFVMYDNLLVIAACCRETTNACRRRSCRRLWASGARRRLGSARRDFMPFAGVEIDAIEASGNVHLRRSEPIFDISKAPIVSACEMGQHGCGFVQLGAGCCLA